MFYLSFAKAMTLNCYNFVYYGWKRLSLRGILKSVMNYPRLSQISYPSILRRKSINMFVSCGYFLQKNTCVGKILSISKFLRAPILNSIFKQLLLKINYLLRKKRFFEHKYQKQVKMYAIIS